MDMSEIARKLGLSDSKLVLRKAAELRRLADIQFDSSIIGVVRFPNPDNPFQVNLMLPVEFLRLCMIWFSGWDLQGRNLLGDCCF